MLIHLHKHLATPASKRAEQHRHHLASSLGVDSATLAYWLQRSRQR